MHKIIMSNNYFSNCVSQIDIQQHGAEELKNIRQIRVSENLMVYFILFWWCQ